MSNRAVRGSDLSFIDGATGILDGATIEFNVVLFSSLKNSKLNA